MKKFTLTVLAVAFGLFANAAVSSTDDLVGTYDAEASGWQWFNYSDWQAVPTDHSVTVTKVDDTTVTIENLLGYNSELTGTVDITAKTITIAPTTSFNSWFTLAGEDSETSSVTGTFDDEGTISFSGFGAWYSGITYLYGVSVTLTVPATPTVEWSVKGSLVYYSDAEMSTSYRNVETTLTKYSGVKKYEYGLKLESGASPEELLFKVYGDSIGIANGQQYTGYAGAYFYTIYDGNQFVWFDTSEDCTKFEGNETAGQLYVCLYDYITSTEDPDKTGYLEFTWGDSTGITAVESDESNASAPVYDLSGRVVSNTKKAGVYIMKGRKVLVK